jgi:CubicO group peptidase (beta-lactamase class C family)
MASIPRLPLVPDLLRRIHVPSDLESVTTLGAEDEPAAGGLEAASVERIWKSATDLYRSGVHPALQLCVRREGAVVLNRAIGHSRGNGPQDDGTDAVRATTETPSCVYSASKAVTAFVIHLLAGRGELDLDDPIAKYISGYERHGKEGITIGHVLAHRAGVPNLPREAIANLDLLPDLEYMREALRDARPIAAPGKLLAYHAVSGGFILGEVVRSVRGKDIREVLAQEILDPLGFRWTNYGVSPEDVASVGTDYVTGPRLGPPFSNLLTRALGSPFDKLVETAGDPRFLTGIVPAANTVTTALELSRFYELMRRGGELDGVRVMDPATIERALTEQSHLELDLSLGFPTRFGYGLMLGAQVLSLFGRDTQQAFGHLGFTNILAWADPERASSVAVLTSGKPTIYPEFTRFYGLAQRITKECPKVPREEWLLHPG